MDDGGFELGAEESERELLLGDVRLGLCFGGGLLGCNRHAGGFVEVLSACKLYVCMNVQLTAVGERPQNGHELRAMMTEPLCWTVFGG